MTTIEKRRVVVTGIGAVTPLGLTLEETWKNVLEGKSGIGKITHFDATECSVQIAAEVKGFDPATPIGPFRPKEGLEITQVCSPKEARRMGRYTLLGLSAGLQAYGDSGLDSIRDAIAPHRMGANIGVGMGGLPEIEDTHNDYLAKGFRRISPFFITQTIPNMVAGNLSMALNLQAGNFCCVSACASSSHSIGESYRAIQRGEADVILAGGSEAVICRLGIGGFAAMRALSTRNDDPARASRPYDKDRDGFVMGEGAAVLVLEEYEFAKRRGARIYAELVGYGLSSDAFHITQPAPDGEGGRRAMELALQDGAINPDQVGYVNAHGTSTPAGDAEEARAIARLFPDHREHLHVSATKSMTGHLLGAAGALEAALSVMAIRENRIPPTINIENLDPDCAATGLDFTADRAIEKRLDYALSNSFGFGGTNAALVLERWDG